MRFSLVLLIPALSACSGQGTDVQPESNREFGATGASSPDGQRHPGQISHNDQVAGRTWTDPAADAPQSVAWVRKDGKWVPVVKIILSGTGDRREITKYGPEGEILEHTMMIAPRKP